MLTISLKNFPSAGAWTAFSDADGFYGFSISADEPRFYQLDELCLFVLGGKEIGGNAAGDILTTNGAQTLTNKTINAPVINGAALPSATGAELQHCAGVTSAIQTQLDAKAPTASPTFTGTVVLPSTTSIGNVSATELERLDGVTSPIQPQLNALSAQIPSPTGRVSTYSLTFVTGAGETTKQISQATLIAPEVVGNYGIDPASIVVSLFVSDGGNKRSMLSIGRSTDDAQFEVNTKIVSGLTQVDFVRFSDLTAETTYSISLHFKLIGQIN